MIFHCDSKPKVYAPIHTIKAITMKHQSVSWMSFHLCFSPSHEGAYVFLVSVVLSKCESLTSSGWEHQLTSSKCLYPIPAGWTQTMTISALSKSTTRNFNWQHQCLNQLLWVNGLTAMTTQPCAQQSIAESCFIMIVLFNDV